MGNFHIFSSDDSAWKVSAQSWASCVQKHRASHQKRGQRVTSATDAPHPKLTEVETEQAHSKRRANPAEEEEEALFLSAEMTQDQRLVLDMALDGASLFIGGEAGTGKSFLLTAIASALTARGLHVAVTAATGIAALNIGGITFHSAFGIPLPTPDDIMDLPLLRPQNANAFEEDGSEDIEDVGSPEEDTDVEQNPFGEERTQGQVLPRRRLQRLKFKNTAALAAVDVIVIDEVSMLHAGFLEALERALRLTSGRDASRPFGGVQLILSGDFMQLTPFASADTFIGAREGSPHWRTGERTNTDRKVCCAVQRHLLAASEASELTCDDQLSQKENAKLEVLDSDRPPETPERQLGRRKREVWYYDKRMFESWCFRRHLLHVQIREPQRQKDVNFAAELNELRRGELPFRLSRSAVLNPPEDGAVRLLPTKAAVKNFNDGRMLELEGESRIFRTQLTMADATSVAALEQKVQQGRKSSRDMRCTRAMLLVHYRLCSPSTGRRVSVRSKGGKLTWQELWQTGRCIEQQCKLPRHSVQLRALPVPLSYSTSLCTLCVECVARTEAVVQARRSAVQAALQRCASLQGGETGSRLLPAHLRSSISLFPREVVRLEPIEWTQLLRRLQPAMQKDFRDAIRRDTVLQDKTLKVGCRVMLLRNLSNFYVNGSLGTVTRYLPVKQCGHLLPADIKATTARELSLLSTAVVVEANQVTLKEEAAVLPIVRMDADAKEVAIPWVVLPVPVVHNDWCYVLRATCLPLTPGYAFTVHKIQGVTLNHPVLFDADGMFPCDHLVYVAASRVRAFQQLRMVNLTPGMISVHIPSLRFTAAIPSVKTAWRRWLAWRATPESSTSLFLPSYKQRQTLATSAKKKSSCGTEAKRSG